MHLFDVVHQTTTGGFQIPTEENILFSTFIMKTVLSDQVKGYFAHFEQRD